MGEPDAHNGQFRRLMQKYGLWKPRYYAPHHYIDTNKAAGLRAEGMSYTEIGKRYGLRNGTIQTILRRAGKDTPTRFKQSLHRGRVDYVEAKRLREEGWTFDQIGARFGVGASAILNGFKYRQKKAATAKDSRATVGQAPPCADAS
jgi:transposase